MISAAVSRRMRLSAWWLQRTPRERVLVIGMAAVAALYLVMVAAVDPLLAARREAQASIESSEAAMARLAALPAGATAPAAQPSSQPAAAILTETATDFGLSIRRIEPEGDGARLTIEDADFSSILRWIDALETEHGLHVMAIEMDRRPEPGVVSANLTVQR